MASILARYWMVVVSVVVVVFLAPHGSSSEILWSEDSLNGCCGECNTSNQCKTTPDLEKTPIKCSFIQYDKTKISPSTSITTSCGKPDKLRLHLAFGNDTVLNVTWKFPRDETIAKVTGFLVTVQYENPSVSGEIVNLFKVNGTQDLAEEELMKLADDVEFVYDCVKVLPNTMYTVTVQALPSIREAALERATLHTNDTGEKVVEVVNKDKIKKSHSTPLSSDPQANCNSRWVAWMFVSFANSATKVCFKSAPEVLKINKYVLHVMPRSQYDGPDPRTPENMENIDLTGRGLSGTTICRNFTLKEKNEYIALLQPDEFCTCFNNDEVCQHTFVNFIVPPATISLSSVAFSSTTVLSGGGGGGSGAPTWHMALIAFFISLVVVTGVILLALYCFINGFKDFLRGLLFHFSPTSDKTVLLIFQPTCDASTTEAVWKFVCHLKWKSRAAIETMPELDTRDGRCAGVGGECIKSKPDRPSVVCQCFCCKMDVSLAEDVVSKVKVEILRYDRIILFHSYESSKNYQVFQKTDDIPVRTCSAFVRVASLYDCKSKPADKERESANQSIIGDDHEQINISPEPIEAVPRNPVGMAQLRSDSETSFELSGRKESGYYSCYVDEDQVAEEMDKMEAQGKDTQVEFQGKDTQVEFQGKDTKVELQGNDTKVEYEGKDTNVEYSGKDTKVEHQEDNLEPLHLFPTVESFERSSAIGTSARSSLDRSFSCCGQSLPPVLHVRLGSDEGVDTDLLKSSFKNPEVFDAVKDFSEIVNKITDTSIHIFESPSVVSEI